MRAKSQERHPHDGRGSKRSCGDALGRLAHHVLRDRELGRLRVDAARVAVEHVDDRGPAGLDAPGGPGAGQVQAQHQVVVVAARTGRGRLAGLVVHELVPARRVGVHAVDAPVDPMRADDERELALHRHRADARCGSSARGRPAGASPARASAWRPSAPSATPSRRSAPANRRTSALAVPAGAARAIVRLERRVGRHPDRPRRARPRRHPVDHREPVAQRAQAVGLHGAGAELQARPGGARDGGHGPRRGGRAQRRGAGLR